jgi:hypothetical protein
VPVEITHRHISWTLCSLLPYHFYITTVCYTNLSWIEYCHRCVAVVVMCTLCVYQVIRWILWHFYFSDVISLYSIMTCQLNCWFFVFGTVIQLCLMKLFYLYVSSITSYEPWWVPYTFSCCTPFPVLYTYVFFSHLGISFHVISLLHLCILGILVLF